MRTITATYLRIQERFGCYLGETAIELTAECESFNDDVTIVWTIETLDHLFALDMNGEELEGCAEVMTEAFHESEREACRVLKVDQQLGRKVA